MTRIEQGQHLLKMIENVDVNDTDALDEIDARFTSFLLREPYPFGIGTVHTRKKYTRSRDALKAIRPDGWGFSVTPTGFSGGGWFVEFGNWGSNAVNFETPTIPTEELAELHAIIQAYIWEIENDKHD